MTVAELALREKRILITFDSDFANILAYPPKDFFGIIRIAIRPPLIKSVTNSLRHVFKSLRTTSAFQGKLIVVEAASFRVRDTI
ncbi:MAG: hypothetical protein A3C07_00810 [Candidatus Sungbacteria bacterium RIFCSPHIGHO2_02_FULL_47_11]|uniref:DUF5615 domain-containing protein n=1 Tax=Candidatus Sungbacteria bacterium RIFCSPHIGHO2_02_FULL_47_11 TaxID=1802270 RepID=A0A1G2KR26_9BACT|nr:MAG: hypothetical protein A3C07_00810 [Candidatus Sungbacteria bacterium RIFCSPHIGHO2_02_FULL_47_11]